MTEAGRFTWTVPDHVVVINDVSVMRGGATSIALLSVRELAARGIGVTLLTGDAGTPPPGLPATVAVFGAGSEHVLQGARMASATRGLFNSRAEAFVRDWIAANDTPHTVYHLHGWSKILSPSVFRALRPIAGRLVLSAHDFFLACPNGGYFDFRLQRPCELRPMGLACVSANCDRRNYGHKLWRFARQAIQVALSGVGRQDVLVLPVHDAMAPLLERGGIAADRIRPLRNPVVPWRKARIPAERNSPFLYVGRLEEDKGVMLAAAAARQAGVKLLVIGTGPLSRRLAVAFPEVLQCGWKSPEEIATIADGARALVMPSRYREAFGLVAVEALASGLPVIVPDYAMLAREVVDGGFGLACDPHDTAALAALLTTLAGDDAMVEAMSRRGHDHGHALAPSPAAWTNRLIGIYHEVLDRASTPRHERLGAGAQP